MRMPHGCLRPEHIDVEPHGWEMPEGSPTIKSTKMLPTLIRRASEKIPYMYTNPYKASKKWPPDFSKLPPNKQFRLERKYRRRVQLKWARPLWMKTTKIAQMGLIGCAYGRKAASDTC